MTERSATGKPAAENCAQQPNNCAKAPRMLCTYCGATAGPKVKPAVDDALWLAKCVGETTTKAASVAWL